MLWSSDRNLDILFAKTFPGSFDQNADDEDVATEGNPPKVVLYWTKYYEAADFGFGLGRKPFIRAGCKVTNCIATNDRSMLDKSDAILFHGGQFNYSDIPDHRLPHQRYVFVLYETLPFGRSNHYFQSENFFNWTMTHRRDSDIYDPIPYGIVKSKLWAELPGRYPPNLMPGDQLQAPHSLLKLRSSPVLVNKTKLAVWFCSNRYTHGKRELYVKELAKHISIDIYGKCGNLECEPHNSLRCVHILNSYKFYIAAENSICPDYVTEKFYRALENGLVPVVYGGADYKDFAPPHSYINVADFRSPKELAEYLNLLDKNDFLYLEYFRWKEHYTVEPRPRIGWCQLCQKLNDPSVPAKSYKGLVSYWFDQVPCLDGKIFLDWIIPADDH